ncbi:c-type cytochrome [Geothrix oryzisoli]|uniref:c-type cytochrome n=1 Tax=Geothrix oryzisoli TaxID=2922721 RepID=UPI001FAD0C6E|nr:c-type cytochrome [Geothrix oryzisoli]
MSSRIASILFATALVLPAMAQSPAANPPAIQMAPARYTSPASGPEMYQAYCATCHGSTGRGDGPAAKSLKHAVPDLTTLARRGQGLFPRDQVGRVILGEAGSTGHGTEDMPEWRPVFRSLNSSQEPVVHMRVTNLTKYIESLQVK